MLFIDSLMYLAGFTNRDLGFKKDLSYETELKPSVIINLLNNPLRAFHFVDSLSKEYREFSYVKVLNLVWWEKFRKIKVSNRMTYKDSVIGHFIDVLHCYNYFKDRAFSRLKPEFISKVKTPLKKLWDTVETSDTLTKDEYMKLARTVLWNHLMNSLLCLLNVDTSKVPRLEDTATYIYKTLYGDIAIGGVGNDIYKGNFVAILDFGGDDVYYVDSEVLIVDLSGDDVYYGNVGSGFFGSSALFDFKGDDKYMCGDMSCASGIMGFGFIYDGEGNDIYYGGYHSIGAGTFGGGFLIDMSGDDIYKSVIYGQGFAGTYGVGLLLDGSGNDVYTIGYGPIHEPLYKTQREGLGQGFSIGMREDFGGGIGILMDFKGNDVYNAGTYAQGVSYWYSLGILYDGEGDDRYICTQYCQGAGIHISVGLLMDISGDDMYFALNGPSIGAAHDLSVGFLYDSLGNDFHYTYGGLGMGLTNSTGIFVDVYGDDKYYVMQCDISLGGANIKREMGGIGMFVDAHGKDVYGCDVKNGERWVRRMWGIGWDGE